MENAEYYLQQLIEANRKIGRMTHRIQKLEWENDGLQSRVRKLNNQLSGVNACPFCDAPAPNSTCAGCGPIKPLLEAAGYEGTA